MSDEAVRVATYNVHDCVGRDRRFDPERTARVLAELDADLIALQEVTLDAVGERVRSFEAATGLRGIDGTLFERGVGRYGNLVLLRGALLESHLHDVSAHGREPRGVIELLLAADNDPLRVFATHLGLRLGERRAQVRRLLTLLGDDTRGAVLLGDFNIWAWATPLRQLSAAGFRHVPVRSFPTRPAPIAALDRVFARLPVTIERCWRHDSRLSRLASDHFPILAELHLAQQAHAPVIGETLPE